MRDSESYLVPVLCWLGMIFHLLATWAMYGLPSDGQNFIIVYPLLVAGFAFGFIGASSFFYKIKLYGNAYTHFQACCIGLLLSLAMPLLVNAAAFVSAVV